MKKPIKKSKTKIWATGIFIKTHIDELCGEPYPEVYTLSCIVPNIEDGKKIQKRLIKLVRDREKVGETKAELLQVILTKNVYDPMTWRVDNPARLNKEKDMLWGDGEGVSKAWWEND